MTNRQIAASTLWQLLSQCTMALLSVITVKCVAVGLSMELAGLYNSAYGYLQLFGILADFGLYAVAIREVSRAENKAKVLGALLVLRLAILCVSMGSALLIVWLLPAWHGTPLPIAVSIAALVPSFTLLAGVLRAVFQVHHRMQYVFIAEVSQRIVTVVLLGGAVWWGVRGSTDPSMLFLFLGMGSLGALTLLLLSMLFAGKLAVIRPVLDAALLRRLAGQAAPYGIAFFATALYRQTDVTLIALLRDDFAFQNAAYGFVQRVMDMAYLLPTFLMNATLPHLRPDDRQAAHLLERTLIGMLLLSGGAALFAWFWARPIMQLLTTEAYLSSPLQPGSDTALTLLSGSMFANGIIVFCFYALLSRHAWRPLVGTLTLAAVGSLTLNLLLIPQLGFVGASVTSIAVHGCTAAALLLIVLHGGAMRVPWGAVGRWLLWMTALSAVLWLGTPLLSSSVRTLVGLAIGGLASVLLAWGTGLLQRMMRGGPLA